MYVILHKLDRLARNRMEDVPLHLAIRSSGAVLLSWVENIDQTPSGMLHSVMSSINEFYSRNLANEVIKATSQEVATSGTPSLAPAHYLSVRHVVHGVGARTVELDPERAPLVD